MAAPKQPWFDGEMIPASKLTTVFRPSPGIPVTFSRSAIITGGRGVGKTTLLRYQTIAHSGVSIYISLPNPFTSLSHTGHGPLALASDYDSSLYAKIAAKASSLLALTITRSLVENHGFSVPRSVLLECLPHLNVPFSSDLASLKDLHKHVATLPLTEFDGNAKLQTLSDLLIELSGDSAAGDKPILLLLDRADMVPTPCLTPIFELLDQSGNYILLVAMRPTHTPIHESSAMAGDHFDIFHVGVRPRSPEWIRFAESTIQAQFQLLGTEESFEAIHLQVKDRVLTLARDSIRNALELFNRAIAGPSRFSLAAAVDDLRGSLLTGAQNWLQRYHSDFAGLLRQARIRGLSRHRQISGPLILNIDPSRHDTLFDAESRLQRFIDVALRCNGLCMPTGKPWSPNGHPLRLECQPILSWDLSDTEWTWENAKEVDVDFSESEIFRGGWGTPQAPSVFIAYRMQQPDSEAFKGALVQAIYDTPRLAGVKVLDGHVPAGVSWASEIRRRLHRCKLAIADVTGMRSEVMFELGFSRGLARPAIPVIVGSTRGPNELGRWLTSFQIARYSGQRDATNITRSIIAHLSDPDIQRNQRLPSPVPGLLIWLRKLEWNGHTCDQFASFAKRNSFNFEILGDNDDDDHIVRRAASASLVVINLDSTDKDAMMHFICGAIIAKPAAGTSQARLPRRVLVLQEPTQMGRGLVAESLRRCTNTVRVIAQKDLLPQLDEYLTAYQSWLNIRHRKKQGGKK